MSDRRCAVAECDRPFASKGYCRMHAERVRRNGHPDLIGRPRKSMAERLWVKVDRSAGPDECWPFTGKLSPQGYGRLRTGVGGEPCVGAHRAAYLLANPDVEPPEVIDHICHDPAVCALGDDCPHRRCCNPSHLAASTIAENSAPDRQWTKRQLNRCSAGHEYDEANTYWWTSAQGKTVRKCRACDAFWHRKRKAS